jgi:hypothetical protein
MVTHLHLSAAYLNVVLELEKTLREAFYSAIKKSIDVKRIRINFAFNRTTGEFRGLAFIRVEGEEEANRVYNALDGLRIGAVYIDASAPELYRDRR